MEERILLHRAWLSKQPLIGTEANNAPDEVPTKESNPTKALQAVAYEKANLKEVVQKCTNLNAKQQSKLLTVLKDHEQIFLGCQGEWKGDPVSIKVMKGATPIWARPYPVPLKNLQVFEKKCSNNATSAHFANSRLMRLKLVNGHLHALEYPRRMEPSVLSWTFANSTKSLNAKNTHYQPSKKSSPTSEDSSLPL
jgi:hypothetical protein